MSQLVHQKPQSLRFFTAQVCFNPPRRKANLAQENFRTGSALYIKIASGENLVEMSDSPVRRTALEVEVFLINRMDGAGQPHEWEEFTSLPIADPRLEGIRLRCVQLENAATRRSRFRTEERFTRVATFAARSPHLATSLAYASAPLSNYSVSSNGSAHRGTGCVGRRVKKSAYPRVAGADRAFSRRQSQNSGNTFPLPRGQGWLRHILPQRLWPSVTAHNNTTNRPNVYNGVNLNQLNAALSIRRSGLSKV